ncbi:signal peptidase II [Agrobacterium sp. P15N1-A]|uniref:signal peptidase II n=1 Tax=Agrobacterium sp. P15N1-A TaxID=3342820 RepID=UPI0037D3D9AE
MKMSRGRIVARLAIVVIWVVALCVIDLTVKHLVVSELMNPPRIIPVTPFFNLTLAYNSGVSFGLLADTMGSAPRLFALLQGVIVLGLVMWAVMTKKIAERVSITVVAGGASGNVVDRFLNLSVTDYLDFHAFGWSWPAFNLADVFIVCGAFILVAISFRRDRHTNSPAST